MIIKILKKVPFIIATLAIINIILVKIIDYTSFNMLAIQRILFNSKTIFYLNYWIIYIGFALFISIMLGLFKKYSKAQFLIALFINVILFIVLANIIINRM